MASPCLLGGILWVCLSCRNGKSQVHTAGNIDYTLRLKTKSTVSTESTQAKILVGTVSTREQGWSQI